MGACCSRCRERVRACCCYSCDKKKAAQKAEDDAAAAARARAAIGAQIGKKKKFAAVAAFGLGPASNDEQERLAKKNKFLSHGRKGTVAGGLSLRLTADFKPKVKRGRAFVEARSVSCDGAKNCWRFLEPGKACLRVEAVLAVAPGPLELRLEESASPDAFDWTQSAVDVVFDGQVLCSKRRPAQHMAWWVAPLDTRGGGPAKVLQISLNETSAPWNYLLQSIMITTPDKAPSHIPSQADVRATLDLYRNAPNPAPTDIEAILDGVPKPQVVEPVGIEEKRIAAKTQKAEEKKRRKAKVAERNKKAKQESGEAPLPTAEELAKERKLKEAQLVMARERAHAYIMKEYREETAREDAARAKERQELLDKEPFMVELNGYRKQYGDLDDAIARIEKGESPEDPLFRETRGQRKGREDAEKLRRENLPDPFREFGADDDPYYADFERQRQRAAGK